MTALHPLTVLPGSRHPSEAPSDTRRLLIVSYFFPPDGAVGGLRWAGITKYLVALGWKVSVVTASPRIGDDNTAADAYPGSVYVERCPHFLTSYQVVRL